MCYFNTIFPNLGGLKRIASILLLGMLLFNWVGYRLVTNYFEQKADTRLELALDNNNYNESELITIKVPTNLPYYNNNNEFTRVDGEINFNGVHYKYVAKRIYNDSIELRCIPHEAKMKIEKAKDDYLQLAFDMNQQTPGKKQSANAAAFKMLMVEYTDQKDQWQLNLLSMREAFYMSDHASALLSCFLPVSEQPPDYIAESLLVVSNQL